MRSRHWRCCAVAVLLFGCARELPPASRAGCPRRVGEGLPAADGRRPGRQLAERLPNRRRRRTPRCRRRCSRRSSSPMNTTTGRDYLGKPWPRGCALTPSGLPPRTVSAQHRAPVVAFSRVGLLGDDALVCVEVFGVQERAFFVLLRRDAVGLWSVRTELEVWAELPPEELPDGELYKMMRCARLCGASPGASLGDGGSSRRASRKRNPRKRRPFGRLRNPLPTGPGSSSAERFAWHGVPGTVSTPCRPRACRLSNTAV